MIGGLLPDVNRDDFADKRDGELHKIGMTMRSWGKKESGKVGNREGTEQEASSTISLFLIAQTMGRATLSFSLSLSELSCSYLSAKRSGQHLEPLSLLTILSHFHHALSSTGTNGNRYASRHSNSRTFR